MTCFRLVPTFSTFFCLCKNAPGAPCRSLPFQKCIRVWPRIVIRFTVAPDQPIERGKHSTSRRKQSFPSRVCQQSMRIAASLEAIRFIYMRQRHQQPSRASPPQPRHARVVSAPRSCRSVLLCACQGLFSATDNKVDREAKKRNVVVVPVPPDHYVGPGCIPKKASQNRHPKKAAQRQSGSSPIQRATQPIATSLTEHRLIATSP